ncbi:Tfp pilus assembly protein FimT/FimU [Vibrio tapetis]|uniref:Putative MSHA pilin protein MshC n=1 Tax=Vibrio tapetis subsp. tapetis TaxID=1671868 RepID=A0A2N8ZFK7_9VIBR|nr:type II secretion system protein [Vibrio tapetis]SON50678.1 putative MSHA pilin protein MshC [Vibrio tapetis subsp. tapetis]
MSSLGKRSAGFTLTELIVVILLIAIMSAYAASKYSGPSQFSVYAAREQAISVIRQIQLGRMQSNIDPTFLGATIPDRYVLSISDGGKCLSAKNSACLESNGSSNFVYINDGDFSFSPNSMELSFDLTGKPSCQLLGGACPVANNGDGYKIDITNSFDSLSVCINSEGFVNDCL